MPGPGWVGRTIAIDGVRLRVDGRCPLGIMTTLSQVSLPKDLNVLRTAVVEDGGNIGVYATVLASGRVRRGALGPIGRC